MTHSENKDSHVEKSLVTSGVCVYRQVNATNLRYHTGVMQKNLRDIFQMIETPLISFTVVVLSCVCFLLGLWAIMIVVRFVMG